MQVSIAFRHFEECLTLAKLDMAWLDEPCNAVLHSTRLLGRRMIIEKLPALPPAPDNGMEAPATAPPKLRTWQYLCACASPDNSFPPQVCNPRCSSDAILLFPRCSDAVNSVAVYVKYQKHGRSLPWH